MPGIRHEPKTPTAPCAPACTRVLKLYTDHEIPASVGISSGVYTRVDGYRHLNVFVEFSQAAQNEPPVDLGVVFAFDAQGRLGARRYVNLEPNVPYPQGTSFIEVSGLGSWGGNQHSSYAARFPVLGPFVQVFVYNRADFDRTVSVWGYLVS
jgi:hypothetical protein